MSLATNAGLTSYARRMPWAGLGWPTVPAGILGFFAILLGSLVMLRPALDPDLGWHLRTGQVILATHHVPHADIYSYTVSGAPWVEQEWLWQAAVAWVYGHWGAAGIALSGSLVVAACLGLIYRTLRIRGVSAVLGAGGTILALINLAPAAGVRPALMSALFSAAFLLFIELYRRNGDWRWLIALVPCQLLWANMHASYVLGPLLCATYGFACAWNDAIRMRGLSRQVVKQAAVPWGSLCIALLGLSTFNPNGFGLLRFTVTASQLVFNREYVHEWQSPNFQTLAAAPLLATFFLAFGLALLSRNSRPTGAEALLLIGGTFAVLQSQEFFPFYAVVSVPAVASMAEQAIGRFMPGHLTLLTGATLAGFLVLLFTWIPFGSLSGSGYDADLSARYPTGAVSFIRQHQLSGPIWNNYNWGGYLIQQLPQIPVFVDGRSEVYGDDFLQKYMAVEDGRSPAGSAFDRYGIQLVLIPPHSALATELRQNIEWTAVYEDQVSTIFTKAS